MFVKEERGCKKTFVFLQPSFKGIGKKDEERTN